MTIDDLKNVRRQKLRVAALEERIERLRDRAEYNQRQLGECGRGDPTRDRLAEYAAELDELERELTGEMIALEKKIKKIDALLRILNPMQESVIRLRYYDGLKWEAIGKLLNYSTDYCKHIASNCIVNILKGC